MTDKQHLNPENPLITNLPTSKQDHFYRLRRDGATVKDAAKIAKLDRTHAYRVDKKLREMDLTHPTTRKLASSALSNFLKGKAFGDIENIPASVTMSAVKEVLDRVHPKTTITQTDEKREISVKIDLTQYQDGPQKPVNGRSPHETTIDMPKDKEPVKQE